MRVGTLEWELKRGGRLSRLERWRMIAAALRLRLLRRLEGKAEAGPARRLAALQLERVHFPDTHAAREALETCTAASSPALRNHCIRTYIFGVFVAQIRGLAFDAELLYVAALLHDLGLTPYRDAGADCHCFAVAGGRAAFHLSEKWDWPAARRKAMREAIVLHLNPSVPPSCDNEAHLLHAGAGLDVLGARPRALPKACIRDVFKQYPRQQLAAEVAAALRMEARAYPGGRTALWERFGFSQAIALDRPGRWIA